MTKCHPTIVSFEPDREEPSWPRALSVLDEIEQGMGYPFVITTDEVATAFKSVEHALTPTTSPSEEAAIRQWFDGHGYPVTDRREAINVLFPWFHDGRTEPTWEEKRIAVMDWLQQLAEEAMENGNMPRPARFALPDAMEDEADPVYEWLEDLFQTIDMCADDLASHEDPDEV